MLFFFIRHAGGGAAAAVGEGYTQELFEYSIKCIRFGREKLLLFIICRNQIMKLCPSENVDVFFFLIFSSSVQKRMKHTSVSMGKTRRKTRRDRFETLPQR